MGAGREQGEGWLADPTEGQRQKVGTALPHRQVFRLDGQAAGLTLPFSCLKASFGVRRLIGVTEIEKGSSYGNQEFKKKE